MRFQLNLALTRNLGLYRFRNIRETVLPILWQEVVLEMPADHQRKLRLLNAAPQGSAYIALGLCLFFSIVFLCLAFRAFRSKHNKDHSLNEHYVDSSTIDSTINAALANKLLQLGQQRVYRSGDRIPTAQVKPLFSNENYPSRNHKFRSTCKEEKALGKHDTKLLGVRVA